MKRLAPWAVFVMMTLPAPAQARDPVVPPTARLRLELQLRTVADQAELARLMRRNSVRVALQRHRLWQQSVAREQRRSETRPQPARPAGQRRRVRRGVMRAAPPVMQPATVAPAPAPVTARKTSMATRPARPVMSRPSTPANLRDLLRQGRSGDADRLERRLRERIREQRRQRERLRNRVHPGSSMGSRRGGRGGR